MNSIRVALPGYNALTDTNPDHFALYSDDDWVLIKEKTRGIISVPANSSKTIPHNLGYIPLYEVRVGGLEINGYNLYSNFKTYATSTEIVFINNMGISIDFNYYIFYDNIT